MKWSRHKKQVITALAFPGRLPERTTYAIMHWGDNARHTQVGEFRYEIDIDHGDKKSYRLLFESEMEYLFDGLTTEHVDLRMDARTFRPVSLICRFETMGHVVEMTGEYRSDKIVIRYDEDGIKDKWVEKVPFEVLDNYQSLIVLRALDFDKLEQNCFSLVNPLTLSVADVECTCINRERIVTPLAEFECHRIALQIYDPVPFTQYHLYDVHTPHHLIKVVKGPLVFELRSIS